VVDYVLVCLVLNGVAAFLYRIGILRIVSIHFGYLNKVENGKSEQVNRFIITSHLKGKCVNSIKLAILVEEFNRANREVKKFQLHILRVGNFID
jgi:hypothetical protein